MNHDHSRLKIHFQHTAKDDAVEGRVGRPITAAGKAVLVASATGDGDRCGSAQDSEGSLRPHPLGVAAHRADPARSGRLREAVLAKLTRVVLLRSTGLLGATMLK